MTQGPSSRSPDDYEAYPIDYPWKLVFLRCEHDKYGTCLVDCGGVPRFFRVRCKATRHRVDGKVTFHIVSLITGERFGPFYEAYRDPGSLPRSVSQE